MFLFVFYSCAYKSPVEEPYSILIKEGFSGRTVKGKCFLKGESFFLKNNFSGGAYGDFIASAEILILYLKPPLSSEVILLWKKGEDVIKMINLDKKKIYKIVYERLGQADLSFYFLGLREKRLHLKRGLLEGEYQFFPEEREGIFTSPIFNLNWKIKELEFTSEPPSILDLTGFKEKEIELPF
ncbi:MAG: hypothetical protein ACP5KO_03375 [Caldimicrobium sp.]